MTINRVEIKNFQSLGDVAVDLGKFTLITGESHSGKSAFMRAIMAAASNVIGTRDIRNGTEDMSVTLVSDTHKVTLHRTVKGRDDYYRITDLATGEDLPDFRTLGVGGVPEEVTKALQIDPVRKGSPSINFHIQFDPPYLLTATGSQIARELGELTNVNEIFEGVREGTRQLKGLNAELKTRQKDLDALVKQSAQFADVPVKEAALFRAEQGLHRARSIKRQVEILRASLRALDIAGQILNRPVASAGNLLEKSARADQIARNLRMVRLSRDIELASTSKLEDGLRKLEQLHIRQHELLTEMGECPTCGTNLRSGSAHSTRA